MLKKDRLLDPQRINLYLYVRNAPLKFMDISGADLVLADSQTQKQRDFIIKNMARLYMTEKGRRDLERADKSIVVVTVGRGELERKEKDPAKIGETKFGGEVKVVGGLTTYASKKLVEKPI